MSTRGTNVVMTSVNWRPEKAPGLARGSFERVSSRWRLYTERAHHIFLPLVDTA